LLVVDDDEGLLLLMAETLREAGHEVATAASAREARERLGSLVPDLLVLDLKLRDGSGPAVVAAIQPGQAPIPFVVVTGEGDEKVAVDVMKQGALDYVIKDTRLLDNLPAVVQRALAAIARQQALVAAQTEHKRLEREILAASERERHSIGADLHDNLGQQLTALELMCTALKEDAAGQPALTQRIDRMCRLLREAITQTRYLARGLVPVGRGPDALQNGLLELAARTDSLGRLRCRFECPTPVAVSDTFVSGHLYRIAQEALNNAVKHSHARTVTIRLAVDGRRLVLEIADDGHGLGRPRERRGGLGLGVMEHRASAIGGDLSVSSRRGEGVTVRCSLPLPS
jgi:signal transduction histidine kinase